jgi:hypothetical protein
MTWLGLEEARTKFDVRELGMSRSPVVFPSGRLVQGVDAHREHQWVLVEALAVMSSMSTSPRLKKQDEQPLELNLGRAGDLWVLQFASAIENLILEVLWQSGLKAASTRA